MLGDAYHCGIGLPRSVIALDWHENGPKTLVTGEFGLNGGLAIKLQRDSAAVGCHGDPS